MTQTALQQGGIFLVDKPKGLTSHDVVDVMRRKLGIRRIGHAGTLDPLAEGLLVLLVGRATKYSAFLSGQDKVYESTVVFGRQTETGDSEGAVVREIDPGLEPSVERWEEALDRFRGEIQQVPPMYSALKHKGQPLYKLARKGKVIEREARTLHVHRFEVTASRWPEVDLIIECSSGTYVRTLAEDLGRALDLPAYLFWLRRIRSGNCSLDQAKPLQELLDSPEPELMKVLFKPTELGLPEDPKACGSPKL
ncbi:MAG: tRNA pseudouridine(55) synthase TruB [Candidatus Omnitrophica bacterium]|nr:tRNA pseudouridine(55) synthase TruB [Candidatus Omnitrophota bacterium]